MVSAEVPADGAAAPATRHDVERVSVGVGQIQPLEGGSSVVPVLTVEAANLGCEQLGPRHDNPLSRHHHGALMGRDVDNQVLPPACA